MIRRSWMICLLFIVLLIFFSFSLHIGVSGVSVIRAIKGIFADTAPIETLIMGEIRFPRTCLAILIGASLALSGASLQVMLRNPLADPAILGISGWASLGAVCVFYTGISHYLPVSLPLFSFIGAVCATLFLLLFVKNGVLNIILAGVTLGVLSNALLSFILNIVPSPYARYEIMHWLMGSLNHVGMRELLLASPGMILGSLIFLSQGRSLDALILGEDIAQVMGFSPQRTQKMIIIATALIIGSSVAVAGGIGFVGLVVPHIIRGFLGGKPSKILLPSALLGAIFVLGADILVRLPSKGAEELQLGVIISLLGCPFFLYQIWSLRGRE